MLALLAKTAAVEQRCSGRTTAAQACSWPRALPGTRTMAGQSKAAESKKNPLSILGPAIFISVLSFASTLPLRPLLLQQILGDADAVSMMLARITASGALSEFIFNPLFGRASAFFSSVA